jgi:hypothetical protein
LIDNLDDAEDRLINRLLQHAPEDLQAVGAHRKLSLASSTHYKVWRVDASMTPQVQSIQDPWVPKLIIPPSRQLPEGSLRDFELLTGIVNLIGLENWGARWLIRETHLRYGNNMGTVECPNMSCGKTFNNRDDLDAHFSIPASECERLAEQSVSPNATSHAKNVINAKLVRIKGMWNSQELLRLELAEKIGESGSEKRLAFEEKFEKQVKRELFPETTTATDSARHEYIHDCFWAWF